MSETNQNNLKMYLVFIWDNLHHLRKSVSFCDAADHFAAFNEINVTPTVFLCFFMIGQMVPNCKTPHMCFLHFQETLLVFLEMNFPNISLVIILWNVLSGKRFSF